MNKRGLRPVDMLKLQTDTYSFPHLFLANQLVTAAKSAQPKDPRARALIEQMNDWNGVAAADSPMVSFLEAARREAIAMLLEPYLGKDTSVYSWRSMTFLQKILLGRPSNWLPPAYKSYDEFLAAVAGRAVEKPPTLTSNRRVEELQWEKVNAPRMLHPIGGAGILPRLP